MNNHQSIDTPLHISLTKPSKKGAVLLIVQHMLIIFFILVTNQKDIIITWAIMITALHGAVYFMICFTRAGRSFRSRELIHKRDNEWLLITGTNEKRELTLLPTSVLTSRFLFLHFRYRTSRWRRKYVLICHDQIDVDVYRYIKSRIAFMSV